MDITAQFISALQGQIKATEQLSEAYKNQNNSNSEAVSRNIVKSSRGSSFDDDKRKVSPSDTKDIEKIADIFAKKYVDMMNASKKDTALGTKVADKDGDGHIVGSNGKLTKAAEKSKTDILSALGTLFGFGASGGFAGLTKLLWKSFKNSRFGKAVTDLFKTIKGSIKNFVGRFKKFFMRTFDNIWNSLKRFGTSIKTFFTNTIDKIKNNKFVKAIIEKVKDITKSIRGIIDKVVRRVVSIGKNIKNFLTKNIAKIGKITGITALFDSFSSGIKNSISKIVDKFVAAKDAVKNAIKTIAEKTGISTVANKVVSGVKSVGGKVASGAKAVAGKVVSGTKAVAGKVASGVDTVVTGAKNIGGAVVDKTQNIAKRQKRKVVGVLDRSIKRAGGMGRFLGNVGKRVPILAGLIETAFAHSDVKKYAQQYENGEITEEEFYQKAGTRVVTGITGSLGGVSGAALGGAIGTMIPGFGTILGGVVGGLGGDALGRFLGGLFVRRVMNPNHVRSIGEHAGQLVMKKGEMQDFIIKGNNVYPFSSKDEVVGMKTGGAFQNMMNTVAETSGGGDGVVEMLRDANRLLSAQIQYLAAIAKNTENSGSIQQPQPQILPMPMNNSGGGRDTSMSKANNSRTGYGNSVYSH